MADERHKTTIEIDVDDRDIRDLGKQMEKTFDAAAVEGFMRAVEKSTRAIETQQRTQLRGVEAMERRHKSHERQIAIQERQADVRDRRELSRIGAYRGAGGQLMDERSGGRLSDAAVSRRMRAQGRNQNLKYGAGGAALGYMVGRGGRAATGASQMVGAAAQPGGMLGQMASGIPVVGPAIQGMVQGVQQLYQEFLGAQTSIARNVGATGLGGTVGSRRLGTLGGIAGEAEKFGLGIEDAAGAAAGLGRQTTLRGADLAQTFGTQMQMQNLLGIQQAGSVVGAARAAGGEMTGREANKLMMDAVSSGLVAGIHEARIDQYLQTVSSWTESVRSQGIDMKPESAMQIVAGMSRLGQPFKGEAGAAAARSVSQGIAGLKDKGGFETAVAYRALARRGMGGGSIVEMRKMLERPSKAVQRAVLEDAVSVTGGDTLALEQFAKNAGIRLSTAQAEVLATTGDFSVLDREPTEAERKQASKKLGQARRAAGGAFGDVRAQREIDRKRQVAGGGDVAAAAREVQGLETTIAAGMAKQVAPLLKQTAGYMKELVDLYKEGGAGAVGSKVASDVAGAATKPVKDAYETLEKEGGKVIKKAVDAVEEAAADPMGEQRARDARATEELNKAAEDARTKGTRGNPDTDWSPGDALSGKKTSALPSQDQNALASLEENLRGVARLSAAAADDAARANSMAESEIA